MTKVQKTLSAAIAVAAMVAAAAVLFAPSPAQIQRQALGSDRVLLAENGQVLQTLRTDFKKRRLAWHPLSNFPEALQKAVIFAEDQHFYSHFGVDPFGLARAVLANIQGRRIQGASTITMQLTDLIQEDVLLGHSGIQKGSLPHKLSQVVRAISLETRWSKAEILEAYLNLIHLRGEFQGVPALSQAYLHRHPLALDQAESLVVAAMISSPNQKEGTLSSKACSIYRRDPTVFKEISGCEALATATSRFFAGTPEMPEGPAMAPHLARRLFKEFPTDAVVTSTLDPRLQERVTAILEKNMFRLKDQNARDTAAIVIENATGKVLVYVGAVSTSDSPHVDGVTSYRQAGSSLKPFIYAKAIDGKTLTAASILLDDPTAISWGGDVYRPANYDKHFYGPVSVREALASSLNVPAVKTVTILGLHQTYQMLQSLQFTGMKEPDYYGVSMALGAVEVRLDELANAYRMLANQGEWRPLAYTTAASPGVSHANSVDSKHLLSPAASYIIASILSDPNARSIGFGWENPLETPFWTAVKTGTSKDYRDNWCAGFSSRYTVAVWAGNFNSEAMHKVSGVSGAGPSWYEIMLALHEKERSEPPSLPDTVLVKNIRHQWASQPHQEFFIRGTEPISEVIEPALEKRVQFIFPAEGSVLVKDPHLDPKYIALSVRYTGSVPENSELLWDGKSLGKAASPFRVEKIAAGDHQLSIATSDGKVLAGVKFKIKGAE